jgi:Peptidase A4 family
MRRRSVLAIGAAAAIAGTVALVGAGGDNSTDSRVYASLVRTAATDVSANWSGYVATAPATTFTSVTGTWRQPATTCSAASAGSASAFWVGLGGASSASQALAQIGTSADCTSSGTPSYYAWYELVPAASVKLGLKIKPGDLITTSVNVVHDTNVLVQIKNRTRKTSFTRELTPSALDLTSADWIAEAPSSCNRYRCRTLALANFGSVSFRRIAAIGNGIGGTLTDPSWIATSIDLVSNGRRAFFPGPDSYTGSSGSTGSASTDAVSPDGRSFTVSWSAGTNGS